MIPRNSKDEFRPNPRSDSCCSLMFYEANILSIGYQERSIGCCIAWCRYSIDGFLSDIWRGRLLATAADDVAKGIIVYYHRHIYVYGIVVHHQPFNSGGVISPPRRPHAQGHRD